MISYPVRFLILGVAYWAMSMLGLQWALVGGAGSPVWPAAGLGVAGLALWGIRLWPAILVARLAAGIAIGSQHPWTTELLIAGGNAAACVVAVLLMGRLRCDPALRGMRDVLVLAAAGVAAGLVVATLGTAALWLSTQFGLAGALRVWPPWVLSFTVGLLVTGPVILAWAQPEAWRLSLTGWLHLGLGLAATAVVSLLVFTSSELPYLRSWMAFPVLIWVAVALKVPAAALALLIVSAAALTGATAGIGSFAPLALDANTRVLLAQQFTAVASLTILILATTADERRAAEVARSGERRLRAVLDQMPVGVALARMPGGELIYHNSRGEEVLGHRMREAQDVAGYVQYGALHADGSPYAPQEYPIARAVLAGETVRRERMLYRRADGRTTTLEVSAAPILDERGRPVFAVSTFDDISARLAAEAALEESGQALRALNADLERRVEEGAARLVQMQKMESLGRLTGGIAHDFNNLLMAVLSNLELLHKRLSGHDPGGVKLAENALHGARRGAVLTRRLLAFARQQDLSPEPVAVSELVLGMADLLKRSLGPEVRIETRFALDVPRALVDPNQLEMALMNLAVNARDALPQGGTITVEVGEVLHDGSEALPPGAYVRLAVSDDGVGMDAETLKRAVEPFYTTKGVGKGTGLGLSTVLGLAEQSGGRFRLDSTPGVGTVAEILLPAAEGAAGPAQALDGPDGAGARDADVPAGPDAPPAPKERAQAAPSEEGGGPLNLLLVDDDALIRMGTAAIMEDLGHRVVQAGSGAEALRLLEREAVDVIVTDQAMPGMTGLQLAARVRDLRPDLPVILATGYAELPDPATSGAVIVGKLNKPFSQAELVAMLETATPRP